MSLIRTSHVALAAAALAAIVVPMKLATPSASGDAVALPYRGDLPPLPETPGLAPEALAGRLFFAPLAAPPDTNSGVPAGEQPSAPLPQLAGTATSRRGRAVAILKLPSGETRMLSRGESADGWTVSGIGNASVTLVQGDRSERLELPRSVAGNNSSRGGSQ